MAEAINKLTELRIEFDEELKRLRGEGMIGPLTELGDIYQILGPAMIKCGVEWELDDSEASYSDGCYMSYIEINWTDSASKKTISTATVSAIGESSEGAAKAKQIAWDTALKCYLVNKFNIRCGSCEELEEAEQNKRISKTLLDDLYAQGRAYGFSQTQITNHLMSRYKLKSLSDLTFIQYYEYLEKMKRYASEKENGKNA